MDDSLSIEIQVSIIFSEQSVMISDLITTTDINENYILMEQLGVGGFAEVRKALFRGDNSVFAVKIVDKSKVSKEDINIYMNECEIMLSLQHPNIIEIFEVYDNPGYFYIVMQFCEGGQLYDTKNYFRCTNESQIAQIILTVTDALDFCHTEKIVHRDIKPENILWSTNDEEAVLKIADFGFAKILAEHDMMTTACGTPLYLAPEILMGMPYDNAVDYWSLGVITYILLSGKPPFEGEDERTLYSLIKNGIVLFPERQWKYISYSAKDFIIHLLEKNPKQRFKAEQIRSHPWIISDHSSDLQFKERKDNLKLFGTSQKIMKVRKMIEQTIGQMNKMEDFSMVGEEEEQL